MKAKRDTERAMSQENVDLVKRIIHAWNERDLKTMRTLAHPDAEYHGLAEWPGQPRVIRGQKELARRDTRVDESFDEFRQEPLEFMDAGDRVVVVFEITAVGKQSGAPVRFTDAAVYTISDGLITRIEICGTREKALEAVGLSE
jgi:ketosteroid isomerase-like protein